METKLKELPDTSLAEIWPDPDHFVVKEELYERCLDGTVVFIGKYVDYRVKGGDNFRKIPA